ncbi:unnamed protein product [Protopolystoma xenopodis]|uniref:Uncharacterized protein n=1 Tax=Protopolystoma xenopodis TaxID=117903 RepID=A0A448XLA0_9PLAT|nr:unnamed protein product [Protopolystoma xenopodis]
MCPVSELVIDRMARLLTVGLAFRAYSVTGNWDEANWTWLSVPRNARKTQTPHGLHNTATSVNYHLLVPLPPLVGSDGITHICRIVTTMQSSDTGCSPVPYLLIDLDMQCVDSPSTRSKRACAVFACRTG